MTATRLLFHQFFVQLTPMQFLIALLGSFIKADLPLLLDSILGFPSFFKQFLEEYLDFLQHFPLLFI